ncbi:HDOD domain-containing protein [Methylomonas koyamae]|uniref:HDOD domain-containing protein n=1 Tax=Methylomonas koyamae TaxID=702114 RepID=UPI00278C5526|nr:HDOD domain-containing protein [Methylomonas koyamae]
MTEAATHPLSAKLAKNRLYQDCFKYMQSDSLALPTIPDVSLKIRRAINEPSANSNKIARVVQIDPSITARLVKISNSPLYRGRRRIESCPEALTRLGLKAAQDIITAFALKAVFNARSPVIRRRMQELWAHSSYVAAISAVLAHKTPGFDPDRAMLAGLIHDIGVVPILLTPTASRTFSTIRATWPKPYASCAARSGCRSCANGIFRPISKTWSSTPKTGGATAAPRPATATS